MCAMPRHGIMSSGPGRGVVSLLASLQSPSRRGPTMGRPTHTARHKREQPQQLDSQCTVTVPAMQQEPAQRPPLRPGVLGGVAAAAAFAVGPTPAPASALQPQTSQASLRIGVRETVLLLDGGYLEKYRYFATVRHHQYNGEQLDIPNLHEDQDFMDLLFRHLIRDVRDWRSFPWNSHMEGGLRIHGGGDSTAAIWCLDAPRDELWRLQHCPEYKAQRKPHAPGAYNHEVVRALRRGAPAHTGVVQLGAAGLEADDVAWLTLRRLRSAGHQGLVVAVTADSDWQQLVADPGVLVFNPKTGAVAGGRSNSSEQAARDLLVKALAGDKSDNITSCKPNKLGLVRAERLIEQFGIATNALEEGLAHQFGIGSVERFRLNLRLVTLGEVPRDLAHNFNQGWALDVY